MSGIRRSKLGLLGFPAAKEGCTFDMSSATLSSDRALMATVEKVQWKPHTISGGPPTTPSRILVVH